jgi:hypothetical protein
MGVYITNVRLYKCGAVQLKRIAFLLTMSISFLLTVSAQIPTGTSPDVEGNDDTRPGRVLSQGSNSTASGNLHVLTYKLEEIVSTRNVRLDNREIALTGFRLTITTAERLRGGSYQIWIGDNSYGAFLVGLHKVGIVLHSRSLPNGATLAVSSLGVNNGEYVPTNITVLPERLFVPPPYGYEPSHERRNSYVLKRFSRFDRRTNRQVQGVVIEVPRETDYSSGANRWFLQIGDKEYVASAGGTLLTVWFTDAEFSLLNDGDKMTVKYGQGKFANGTIVGGLNKSVIQ